MPANNDNASGGSSSGGDGQSGDVAGEHSGQSKDHVPKPHAEDGGDNLANDPVKIISGRFSPASHLNRDVLKK